MGVLVVVGESVGDCVDEGIGEGDSGDVNEAGGVVGNSRNVGVRVGAAAGIVAVANTWSDPCPQARNNNDRMRNAMHLLSTQTVYHKKYAERSLLAACE